MPFIARPPPPAPGVTARRVAEVGQHRLDARPVGLQPGRQDQALAEGGGVLVDGEAGALGGELEQHAAGLHEVDRAEPEAVDHLGRSAAGAGDGVAQGLLVLAVGHRPREVVDAADAPGAAAPLGVLAHVEDAAGAARGRAGEDEAHPAVLLADALEAHHLGQEAFARGDLAQRGAGAVQPADLLGGRHGARVPGGEREGVRSLDQGKAQAVGIGEGQGALAEARGDRLDADAGGAQAALPGVEGPERHRQVGLLDHADTRGAGLGVGPGEEGQVGSGVALAVRVEQVVGGGVVLVDALLDEPESHDALVEAQVLDGVAGDGGDVVQANGGAGVHARTSSGVAGRAVPRRLASSARRVTSAGSSAAKASTMRCTWAGRCARCRRDPRR
jgi:hypothetical protein